jgi:hypothetical protein
MPFKPVDMRPESNSESAAPLATASFLLFLSFALPFIGGLGEATHPGSQLTDGRLLFGIILGAIACGVIGLSLVGKSSRRVKSFLPGLLCVLLAGLPIVAIRLAEVKHWLVPAGPADFWLALEAVISAPILALLGLTLIRKGPRGLWNNVLSCIAFLAVVVVMGFSFLGMIGVLL